MQTRWSYLNRDYNFLTEVEAMLLDGHFILEHGARSRAGYFFNFNGTAGILRRTMIDDAGGWQHDTLTEDSDLSYRAQLKGWRFVYLPGLDCPSELPVEMHGFQVQQSRWAKGLTQVAKKLLPRLLRANIPLRVKVEAFMHLTPNISYPLMIVVSALMLPVMIVRFYMGVWQMVFIDLPLIAASFWSISLFYVVAQRELYPKNWKRSILLLPMLMAVGVGLTIINTRAVLEALFGVETGFVRTPKYRALATGPMNLETKKYRRRSGWLPYVEILVGTYFAGHDRLRHRELQLPLHSVPGAVRVRVLLGGLQHAVPGAPGPAAVAEAAAHWQLSAARQAGRALTPPASRLRRSTILPSRMCTVLVAVGGGFRVVRDHEDGLAQALRSDRAGSPARPWSFRYPGCRWARRPAGWPDDSQWRGRWPRAAARRRRARWACGPAGRRCPAAAAPPRTAGRAWNPRRRYSAPRRCCRAP